MVNKDENLTGVPSDFDPDVYLELNKDVKNAGVDPFHHYATNGVKEGRVYKKISKILRPNLDAPYSSDGLESIHNHDFMIDPSFVAAYDRGVLVSKVDHKWYWRVHIGLWAATSSSKLEGDYVECGVNWGFLSSAIMHYLDWDSLGKTFYLLDTFEGLDQRYVSELEKMAGVMERNTKELEEGGYTSSFDSVRKNFSQWENVRIIKGTIPDTLPRVSSEKVAFLHIDLNCSPPEVASMEYFWPKLQRGGIVLLDDYAYYGYHTQKIAMDEWAKDHGVAIASLPTGQGLIIKN